MMTADFAERKRTLSDFDNNLLVEAAAGTGKTSLIAGRVALMLAHGYDPASMAAITFTELAASELEHRIRWTVSELRDGRIPPALTGVVKLPLGRKMLANLNTAAPRIDQITTTTIHGFCKTILQSHGVSAKLDPGARVVDETVADALFDEVLTTWLYDRLSGESSDEDPIAVLAHDDPLQIVKHIRELAYLRRSHLDAKAPQPSLGDRPDVEFAQAVDEFARWHAGSRGDSWTGDLIADLQGLSAYLQGSFSEKRSFAEIWRYVHPPRIAMMRKYSIDLLPYNRTAGWQSTYGRQEGQRLARESSAHFEAVVVAYRTLIGRLAQVLVASLSASLDAVLENYTKRKHESAILDFDDLLRLARDLVCASRDTRRSVAARYPHLLVDEFQDTDPLQAEIIFCLCAKSPPTKWHDAVLRPGSLFLVGDPKQARVAASAPQVSWVHPSDRDPDRAIETDSPFVLGESDSEVVTVEGAGSLRGDILHKLMEELLTGELSAQEDAILDRAVVLLKQLLSLLPDADRRLPNPKEVAATALRTLLLPALQPLKESLIPEYGLWGAGDSTFFAGRADAVSFDGERIVCVVDWKSDVRPSAPTHSEYVRQLTDYLEVADAPKGAIVYMTSGEVVWVERRTA